MLVIGEIEGGDICMEEEEEYFDRNVLWKFCFEVIIFIEEEIV